MVSLLELLLVVLFCVGLYMFTYVKRVGDVRRKPPPLRALFFYSDTCRLVFSWLILILARRFCIMTFMRTVPLDDLGRMVLPAEVRAKLGLHEGRKLDVYYTEDNTVVLHVSKEVNNDLCNLCHVAEKLVTLNSCNICKSCSERIADMVRLNTPQIKKRSKPDLRPVRE